MTSPAPYDQLRKQTILNRITALLYTLADNQMRTRIDALIMRNAVAVKASHASFMYRAVNYSCDASTILPRPRNQLSPLLEVAMQEYLAEKDDLAQEKPVVHSYLTQVLNSSDHPEDWIKLLIPTLHPPIRELLNEYSFQAKRLSDEAIEHFLANHKEAVSVVKRRLVTNLIST